MTRQCSFANPKREVVLKRMFRQNHSPTTTNQRMLPTCSRSVPLVKLSLCLLVVQQILFRQSSLGLSTVQSVGLHEQTVLRRPTAQRAAQTTSFPPSLSLLIRCQTNQHPSSLKWLVNEQDNKTKLCCSALNAWHGTVLTNNSSSPHQSSSGLRSAKNRQCRSLFSFKSFPTSLQSHSSKDEKNKVFVSLMEKRMVCACPCVVLLFLVF